MTTSTRITGTALRISALVAFVAALLLTASSPAHAAPRELAHTGIGGGTAGGLVLGVSLITGGAALLLAARRIDRRSPTSGR